MAKQGKIAKCKHIAKLLELLKKLKEEGRNPTLPWMIEYIGSVIMTERKRLDITKILTVEDINNTPWEDYACENHKAWVRYINNPVARSDLDRLNELSFTGEGCLVRLTWHMGELSFRRIERPQSADKTLLKIAAEMLDLASGEFANHGCEDHYLEATEGNIALVKDMIAESDDPDAGMIMSSKYPKMILVSNVSLMMHCAKKLR